MSGEAERIEGHCLCGAVSIRASPVSRHVEACHCTMCRRWGGIQCGSDVEIDGEAHVVRYRSSEWAERGFCGVCGSNLFYRYLPLDNYNFTAGLFADDALLPLSEEIFVDERPAYYSFDAESEKLTGAEVMAKFDVK